jgi:hypothetical protein
MASGRLLLPPSATVDEAGTADKLWSVVVIRGELLNSVTRSVILRAGFRMM